MRCNCMNMIHGTPFGHEDDYAKDEFHAYGAHPMGEMVRVTNQRNGKEIAVCEFCSGHEQ